MAKSIRTTFAVLSIMGIGLVILMSDSLIRYGIEELSWAWMTSYLVPKLLLLIFTTTFIWAIWLQLTSLGRLKFVVVISLFSTSAGAYVLVNTPYIEWVKKGADMTNELSGNPIENYLNEKAPGFDGLICLALPGCKYCEIAVPKLAVMKKRVPELDVIVFVFAKDSTGVKSFQTDVSIDSFPFRGVPEPNNSIKLCQGKFPTFLYFKNGKVIHRWFNSEFGYPAFDWVEARLK